jgi:hypothetical protein
MEYIGYWSRARYCQLYFPPYRCQGQLQTPQSVSELLEFFAHLNNLETTEHVGREGDIKYELCL